MNYEPSTAGVTDTALLSNQLNHRRKYERLEGREVAALGRQTLRDVTQPDFLPHHSACYTTVLHGAT